MNGPRLEPSNYVFLSAGVPEKGWRDAPFQRHEIVQAVIATARGILGAGGSLLFGGHPLITPLVFDLANELLKTDERMPRVVLYQSTYFADALPETVWTFRQKSWCIVEDIPSEDGPDGRDRSLEKMRDAMLAPTVPITAGIFIGGKPGIRLEYDLFRMRFPTAACFPMHRPGGTTAQLDAANVSDDILADLVHSAAYVHLTRRIVEVLASI